MPAGPKAKFEHGHDLMRFLLGHNKRAQAWVEANFERLGLDHPLDKSTISLALNEKPVPPIVVRAFQDLYREIYSDPWAWCRPPDTLEELADFHGFAWWYRILRLDDVLTETAFDKLRKRPLKPDVRAAVQERLDTWSAKLRDVCEQQKADGELVRAYTADLDPQMDEWVSTAEGIRRGVRGDHVRFTRRAPYGLHHLFFLKPCRTTEDFVERAARAKALFGIDLLLPDIDREPSLGYAVALTQDDYDWAATMVDQMLKSKFADYTPRAWNGESWEYVVTRGEKQELWRYVWDDAAWDYREEVVGLHKVWEPRRDTGYHVPDQLVEPPEDVRVWVDEDVERVRVDGRWVSQKVEGHWAYPGGDRVKVVPGRWVPGEVTEGYWRDATEDEKVFHLTGLRRLTFDLPDRETWLANRKKLLTARDYQPTDDEWEAKWVAHRDRMVAEQEAAVAAQDQVIADALAALNTGQPG